MSAPRRILIYGVTGAGKTTAAIRIGERLGLPVVLAGNRETWRQLLSRDSIVLWHVRSWKRKRATMRAWAADPSGPRVVLFRRARELDRWIDGL